MHPRIRTQAYLVGALPLAFLIILLVLGLIIERRTQFGAGLEQHTQVVLSHIDRTQKIIQDINRTLSSTSIPPANAVPAAWSQMRGQLATLDRLVSRDPGMPARMAALELQLRTGFAVLDKYVALRRSGKDVQAQALINGPAMSALSRHLLSAYAAVVDGARQNALSKLSMLRARNYDYEIALVVACVVGIFATLLVSGRFGLRISQRLGQLADNARRLANGESVLPLLGSDEFADLDVVYQTMMRQIVRQQQLNSRLQNMLLPQQLPAFDGIRIDTAYVPAAHESEVGGDWYDAFTIAERRICISIGDVAGHGLRAAAIMASVRLAVRTAARMQDDPAHIVAQLNRVICADEPDTLVTALVAMLDIDDGTLCYAVAGHPEPMLIDSDRRVQLLAGKGLVLGADPNASYETFSAQLHEGWALLLYTDGLIEVSKDYFKGVEELRSAASEEAASSSQNIAEAIQQRVFHGRRADDDAAVLFIGVTRLGIASQDRARRSWTLDATDAESAHRAKRAILWHLGDAIRDEAHLASIELVLGELIGNVARHSPGLAEVTLERQDARTVLRVCDRGKPFEDKASSGGLDDLLAESGRGLFIVRSMSQDLRVEHNGMGNVITAVLA